MAEALGMRPLVACCHGGLGTLYTTTGQREQARTALAAAISLYRTVAMTFWLPQAEATLTQVGDDQRAVTARRRDQQLSCNGRRCSGCVREDHGSRAGMTGTMAERIRHSQRGYVAARYPPDALRSQAGRESMATWQEARVVIVPPEEISVEDVLTH